MSQSTATARVASRAPQRRTTTAQPLHVVPARAGHPGSGLFAALCMLLLVGGLMGLLMLNAKALLMRSPRGKIQGPRRHVA